MNVVYSSDEQYVQHMAVSMLSLFKSHIAVANLNIYIISNGITEESRYKLEQLANTYQRTICWIDFTPFRDSLTLDMEWSISISSYARLFVSQILPDDCHRVLYLDCDTIVCRSLESLWELDMAGKPLAAVMDLVATSFKEKIGLRKDDIYVNAGVLLIDIERWRERELTEAFLAYIECCKGRVTHHDQGVINHCLNGEIYILSPQYNAMTPFFTSKYENMIQLYNLHNFYSKDAIDFAIKSPSIIHFTPEFVGRVWEEGCNHPKVELYRSHLEETCWKGLIQKATPLPLKLKLLYWMYNNLPIPLLKLLLHGKS